MVNPLTRKEIFEEAIARGEVPTIKPLTRQEIIMAKEARRESQEPGGKPVRWEDIEGRPFYSEVIQEVEVVPETTLTDPAEDGFVIPTIINDMTVGDIYTVNYNGTSYDCVAQDGTPVTPGFILLGNGSNFGLVGNDEPFMIITMVGGIDGIGGMLLPLDGTTEGTLSITHKTEVIHKLDPKYLDLSGVQACGAKVYYGAANELSDAMMYLYTDKECTRKETLEGFLDVMEQQVPALVNIMVMGSVYGVATPLSLTKDENGTSGKLFAMTGRDEFIELYTAEYVG